MYVCINEKIISVIVLFKNKVVKDSIIYYLVHSYQRIYKR